jgi:hypothetical protein
MALHRDIRWIGRQWAVTGFGMQAIDQRHGGHFDIEVADLWNDELLAWLSEQHWFNADDFNKGLAIARRRYPEPPRAIEAQAEREFEPVSAPEPIPEPAPVPEPVLAPPPLTVAPLPADDFREPPAIAEISEPETPIVEPASSSTAAPSEDLLSKWFEAYGLDKTSPEKPRPEPRHEPASPTLEQAQPDWPVENATALELSAGAAPTPTPPSLHMPVTVRARFVRPWRVPIRAVQSYRL